MITFSINIAGKILNFNSDLRGIEVDGKEYISGSDGILIYDQTQNIKSNTVNCQLSSNTSALIPALRILGIKYNTYFDQRDVVDSQNNIQFYWNRSKLAGFYNKFSTDAISLEDREPIIRDAIQFLIDTADKSDDFLPEEYLNELNEKCVLLGFYEGFPIYDGTKGMSRLLSRLGIHVDTDTIMISTPMDKYSDDVIAIAKSIENKSGELGSYKKNRVIFKKTENILKVISIEV